MGSNYQSIDHLEKRARSLERGVSRTIGAILSLIFLAVGTVLLTAGWKLFSEQLALQELSDRLTARADGEIKSAWWQIDLATENIASAIHWHLAAKPRLCIVTDYSDATSDPTAAVFCRRWSSFSGARDLIRNSGLGGGHELPWIDANGHAVIDVRFTSRTFQWLASNEATDRYRFGFDDRPTALEAFDAELDEPDSHLIRAWSQPRSLPMRHNPSQPGEALPASVLEDDPPFSTGVLVVLIIPGLLGAILWIVGCRGFMLGRSGSMRLLVPLITLGLLPYWGPWVLSGLNSVWPDAGELATMVQQDLLSIQPAVRIENPGYRGDPGDVLHPWSLETSEYAPAFDGFDLSVPVEPMTPEQALAGLVERIWAQTVELPDERLAALFRTLQALEEKRRRDAGLLFMDAALRLSLDESRSDQVRYNATMFLREKVGFGGFLSTYRSAPNARLKLWQSLRAHPDTIIRNDLENVLERSREEWTQRGWVFPDPES